jgi:hypothetical protein
MEQKQVLLDQIWAGNGQAIFLQGLVATGVLVSYMFSISKDFDGTKTALRRLAPSLSDKSISQLDLFLVLVFGPVIATILLNPSNYVEALTAGVGWVGTLNTISGATK